MLKQRILTALLLGPIVLAIIWFGNDLTFNLFVTFLAFMISFEWMQIVNKKRSTSLIISSVIALFLLSYNYANFIVIDVNRIVLAALIIWVVCFAFLVQHSKVVYKYKAKIGLGIAAILFFGVSLNELHRIPRNGHIWTLALILLIWVADIGAYVSGKSFGKNKLAINISPGKTIEGLLGGMILCSILGYFVGKNLPYDAGLFALVFAVIAGVSVIGDLFASLIKRHGQVKDSGHLLPGHGGFLDRFDSLVAATPFYFGFVHYILTS